MTKIFRGFKTIPDLLKVVLIRVHAQLSLEFVTMFRIPRVINYQNKKKLKINFISNYFWIGEAKKNRRRVCILKHHPFTVGLTTALRWPNAKDHDNLFFFFLCELRYFKIKTWDIPVGMLKKKKKGILKYLQL